jgi:ABC-type antimicrobial peptide transport system permease subunit
MMHTWFSPNWVVRTAGSVDTVGSDIRRAIAAVDPLLPVSKLESMTDVQSAAVAPQRFMSALVGGLGAIALLLAAVGIHGLISASVTERTRELGVRLALGASALQVMRTVVAPGLAMAGAGVAVGAAASLAVVRLMESYIWGVSATDPWTFAAVALGLLLVALLASVTPALRVLRLDPALTLRAE